VVVVAGVVTYNPDLARLRENLESALPQVQSMVIIDNCSDNILEIKALIDEFPQARLQRNLSNRGMARALNQVMGWAISYNAEWALLLDQDSVCSTDMVAHLRAGATPGVGLVAPTILDRNLSANTPLTRPVDEVNYCITSGSLCRVSAWQDVDGYDERMFIDFVDFDFCLRMRLQEWRIVRVSHARLMHEIGRSERHGRVISYNHSAARSYHIARDMLYYAKKHRRSPRRLMVQRRGFWGTMIVLFRKAAIVAIYESDRRRRIGSLLRGIADATFRRSCPDEVSKR
jgi:rhamnosyltransferase